MFATLILKLNGWMERTTQRHEDAWLGASPDIAELERRMRGLETGNWYH